MNHEQIIRAIELHNKALNKAQATKEPTITRMYQLPKCSQAIPDCIGDTITVLLHADGHMSHTITHQH